MKLLTHNMLACHIRGVQNNYPFKIEAAKVEEREADYDPGERGRIKGRAASAPERNAWVPWVRRASGAPCLPCNADFLRHIYPRIRWDAFLEAAQSVSGVH
jgi:multifunctional methyltransferase subunit TRM112